MGYCFSLIASNAERAEQNFEEDVEPASEGKLTI